jgi:hypothetical protein
LISNRNFDDPMISDFLGFSDYRYRSVDLWRRVPSLERAAVRKKTVSTPSRSATICHREARQRRTSAMPE